MYFEKKKKKKEDNFLMFIIHSAELFLFIRQEDGLLLGAINIFAGVHVAFIKID